MKYLAISAQETEKLAKKLAAGLKGGETIGLVGDLGAGKTTFAKALAKALGVKVRVTSPTFVLLKLYPARKGQIKHLVHIDAYRLDNTESLEHLGVKDYWGHSDTVTIIEWADRIKALLPRGSRMVRFQHSPKGRYITFKD
ncbi:MAG: tRNA (adenosine(37)-N6)-threonylcarbamoyltransferase complex ATPase subunit type 1 TsaE [Candidatus Falkowbacteria bacterium]